MKTIREILDYLKGEEPNKRPAFLKLKEYFKKTLFDEEVKSIILELLLDPPKYCVNALQIQQYIQGYGELILEEIVKTFIETMDYNNHTHRFHLKDVIDHFSHSINIRRMIQYFIDKYREFEKNNEMEKVEGITEAISVIFQSEFCFLMDDIPEYCEIVDIGEYFHNPSLMKKITVPEAVSLYSQLCDLDHHYEKSHDLVFPLFDEILQSGTMTQKIGVNETQRLLREELLMKIQLFVDEYPYEHY